jgi:hypothetical protein
MTTILSNSTFIFWGAITLMATVPVIAHYWARVRKFEIEANLKQEMIRQGMSAAEIIQVLESGQGKKRPEKRASGPQQRKEFSDHIQSAPGR